MIVPEHSSTGRTWKVDTDQAQGLWTYESNTKAIDPRHRRVMPGAPQVRRITIRASTELTGESTFHAMLGKQGKAPDRVD